MIDKPIDYLISSTLGNEKKITKKDLEQFQIVYREGNIIYFLYNRIKYKAEILDQDQDLKQVKLRIDDHVIDLNLKDDLDQLIDKMGMSTMEEDEGGDIVSPMPGLVLDILVKEGDEVKKGDSVLVLEAMKMENLLKASADGIVEKIRCAVKETVDKGDLLVVIQ